MTSYAAIENVRELLQGVSDDQLRRYGAGWRYAEIDAGRALKALDPAHREALAEVGYDLADLEVIARLAAALNEARVGVRSLTSAVAPRSNGAVVDDAVRVRDLLVTACRYHLRRLAGFDLKIEPLASHTSIADLSQDLDILAAIVDANLGLFAANRKLDAPSRVAEARDLARQLRELEIERGSNSDLDRLRDARDRAATLLSGHLNALAAAVEMAVPESGELVAAIRNRR